MTTKFTRTLTLAALCAVTLPLAVLGAGGSSAPTSPSLPPSPAMTADDHYNKGLKHRDKAWEYEAKAEGLEGAKAKKLLEKAKREFEKAIRAQEEAIELDPRAYRAYSSLGYALRRVGRYDESIVAYDRSLAIQPAYAEAIEYRGQAYLGLGRLQDAKSAYMQLFSSDRAKADELLAAMRNWCDAQTEGGAEVEEFAAWVEERAELAEQTAMLSGARPSW